MPRFEVDGVAYDAQAGQTVLEALDACGVLMQGVDVPHYCWHPKLSLDASCGMCQVEVVAVENGATAGGEHEASLATACDLIVREGMVLRTSGPRVQAERQAVSETLLVNHPLDCPICDKAGECRLQDYAFDYGVAEGRTREPRRALEKQVELGPEILLDRERCILCTRCVRFCREVPQTNELAIVGRADAAVVDVFPGAPLDNAYSMNVSDLCPVGALTTRDFRFKQRVWLLDEVPALCTGCANGCNLYAGISDNEIQRFVPRRNDAVNETWLCDEGRLSYRKVTSPARVTRPMRRGHDGVLAACTLDAALDEAGLLLAGLVEGQGAGVIAGVTSGHASNEELLLFRRFLDALGTDCRGLAVRRGASDDVLVRSEKAPNAVGARALGFVDGPPILERIQGGQVHGLVALGHDLLDSELLGSAEALRGLDAVIVIDTHHSDLELFANVLLPARHAAEQSGTYTNFAGRVQRSRALVEPCFEAYAAGHLLERLGAAMGFDGFDGSYDVRKLSSELANARPAFSAIDFDAVGDEGIVLRGSAVRDFGTSESE